MYFCYLENYIFSMGLDDMKKKIEDHPIIDTIFESNDDQMTVTKVHK